MTPNYATVDSLFHGWREDVLTGSGPITFPHTLPTPEIVPGEVMLLGGAPGAGKTALVMQAVVEAMRATSSLRVLVANVEMSPQALIDRQLARLSGIEAEVIRRRAFTDEHSERLAAGIATIETFADRLAFLTHPYDLRNVALAADAHEASVVVIDYLQRILPPGDITDTRLRANATMDLLRQFAARGVAVIALSAIGRGRDDKGRSTYAASSMSLASYRDSGELEYGGDQAFLIAPADEADQTVMRLSHVKNRHGPLRTVDLRFDRAHQAFTLIGDAATEPKKRKGRPKAEPFAELLPSAIAALWNVTEPATDDEGDDE